MKAARVLLGLAALLVALSGRAETFTRRVISIADGDTLTVLVDRHERKVRLVDVDAPEKKQLTLRNAVLLLLGKDHR